ncbi:MAG: TauD/TfdA family dioxygenase [Tistlia sp.]|uniref:TauD/TfdA dioxygenase family protein n=1 Tax=Tistlia sp. TaxID=3057121 RepID=UPI0034A2428C
MAIEIVEVDAPLGHEIRGVDLAGEIDAKSFAAIEAAYDRYGVVVFRGRPLTPPQQLAFSRRFGPLQRYVLDRYNHKQYPEIFVVSNVVENGEPIGMADAGRYWHTDMWLTRNPPRGSILHALEVPERDGEPLGDTWFASTAAAYDALDEAMKRRLEGLRAVFSTERYLAFRARTNRQIDKATGKASQAALSELKSGDIEHPLVSIHPRTGRRCLYLCEGVISSVIGLAPAESDALVAFLEAHVVRPEFVYRHRWQVGDLVMWDNVSCLHKATDDFELPQRRLMHRTTLASQAPAPAAVGGAAA